jgi:hypothetical protein
MNDMFAGYAESSRALIQSKGVPWELPVLPDGQIDNHAAWDLTQLAGAVPPPTLRLSDLGYDRKTLDAVNNHFAALGRPLVRKAALSKGWQDLIKAATVEQLLIKRNTPGHINLQVIRPLRVLGTCVMVNSGAEPWDMALDDVQFAVQRAQEAQAGGKLAELVASVIRYILDSKHLCHKGPFYPLLKRKGVIEPKRGPQVLKTLGDRPTSERLPEDRALWELVRIVACEKPRTFADAIRFAQIKLLILCGMRIGEVCSIPADWRRTKEYLDLDGRSAGEAGGISTSLMVRHFAEKLRGREENSLVLYEAFQHIPSIFEQIIEETLDGVLRMTAPLRDRLREQAVAGRLFPEFPLNSTISRSELYVRWTGNPQISTTPIPDAMIEAYRESFDPQVLEAIRDQQGVEGRARSRAKPYHNFWRRLAEAGWPDLPDHIPVALAEEMVRKQTPTKISDTTPFLLGNDKFLRADELMFLMPKRALSETRNGGICDISRYVAIGRVTPEDLEMNLAAGPDSLFARYGGSEEDWRLGLNTHSLRHLQNTELFRLGIADTIITKRFNRRSVAQSYHYDHRSLAEQLSAIDLPAEAQMLPEKAKTVAKLIQSGRVSGPIVEQFRQIQREHGDERAFEFLSAEADGFHATPYGHCINSFTVDPCPKHLQCFDGCNHLVATDLSAERANLERTRENMARAVEQIGAMPPGVGRDNQLRHAQTMVASIDKVLSTKPGDRPFPDGTDRSPLAARRTPFDDPR